MSDKTKIDLKLSKEGPGTVYSSDLKGPADIVFDKIPLTFLEENSKVELVASATLGLGIDHAKHNPGLCYYRHLLEVKSTPDIDTIVKKSKSQFKPEKLGVKWLCDLTDATIDKIKKLDKEAVSDSTEMLLTIESYGNMPAKDILQSSMKALSSNLGKFEKAIK